MTGRVLVIGSINADNSIRMARLPAPGETVGARSVETALGGKGANQAVAAARAGAHVTMVGAIGENDGGPLLAALDAEGIDTSLIARVPRRSSGRALVMVDDSGENSIVVIPGTNHDVPDANIAAACSSLAPGDVVLLQNEIPGDSVRLAAGLARQAGATVMWNAAPAPSSADELIRDIDVLIVNEHELASISESLGASTGASDSERVHAISSTLHVNIVCTRGADGAAYSWGLERGQASALRVTAVDTTAAGDTFVGYLAASTPLAVPDRVRLALAAGSLAVTRPGAAVSIPTRTEVERLLTPPTIERT